MSLLVTVAVVFGVATILGIRARAEARRERLVEQIGQPVVPLPPGGLRLSRLLAAHPARPAVRSGTLASVLFGSVFAAVGLRLAGWPVALAGAAAGAAAPALWKRRLDRRRHELLERQLAELVDSCSMAVRGGASVVQALEFAAEETPAPMAELVGRLLAGRRLGETFGAALSDFADALGTEDARLFVLVMGIHHRSGGNVAGALEEVTSTIRHRIGVRRELRALTAQGRISGTILGALPIAFFLVLAASSGRELAPVYRSPAGMAMILGGLVLEALAYLWIRSLLRVDL